MEKISTEVTIIITPRDRYTGINECIENLYKCTEQAIKLIVLDLDYPKVIINSVRELINEKNDAEIVSFGAIIPMDAHNKIRESINTPYTVFLDNDSDATLGWLPPLLETAKNTGAAIVNQLTLERSGVDDGDDLRNHLYTSDIRVVQYNGKDYLIENKHYRRTPVKDIPKEIRETETFELHCVLFDTELLKQIEMPHATIREHIDISMQIQAMGKNQYIDPRSVVEFDNLGTRASLQDLKYFDLRWNSKITKESSDLFEKRWGYRFYSEQSMYNWAIRRRFFLILNYFFVPKWFANKVANMIQKLLLTKWDPMDDPIGLSQNLYESLDSTKPVILDHLCRM